MATATPGHDAVGRTEAIGRFGTPTDVQFRFPLGNGRHVVNVHGAQQTMMQRITVQAGGHTGWHTHPGPAVAIVQEGSLTLYQADDPTCTGSEYSGTVNTFIDPGQGNVHLARNEGDVPAVIWVTYFDVPEGGSPRTDAADPGYCTF
jgi:quercetin dioxygenase-like cupin family protein